MTFEKIRICEIDFFVDDQIIESLQDEIDSLIVFAALTDYEVKCNRYIQNQISVLISNTKEYSICEIIIDTNRDFKIKNINIFGFGKFGERLGNKYPAKQKQFSNNYIKAFRLAKSFL